MPGAVARAVGRRRRAVLSREARLACAHASIRAQSMARAVEGAELGGGLAKGAGVARVARADARDAQPVAVAVVLAPVARQLDRAILSGKPVGARTDALDARSNRRAVVGAVGDDGEHRHRLVRAMRELEPVGRRQPQRAVRDGAHTVVLLVFVSRVEADDGADLEAVERGEGDGRVAYGRRRRQIRHRKTARRQGHSSRWLQDCSGKRKRNHGGRQRRRRGAGRLVGACEIVCEPARTIPRPLHP